MEVVRPDEKRNVFAIFGLRDITGQNFRDRPDQAAKTPDIGIRSRHYFSPRFFWPADCRSIHLSISLRRNRQVPPTLKPGILPSAAWR